MHPHITHNKQSESLKNQEKLCFDPEVEFNHFSNHFLTLVNSRGLKIPLSLGHLCKCTENIMKIEEPNVNVLNFSKTTP